MQQKINQLEKHYKTKENNAKVYEEKVKQYEGQIEKLVDANIELNNWKSHAEDLEK